MANLENEQSNGTEAVERKTKRAKRKRSRLAKMILPVRRSVPEHFERLGCSESVAEGYGVIRADIQDRVLHGLCHRVRILEAWRNLGASEPIKKPVRNENGLRIVEGKLA